MSRSSLRRLLKARFATSALWSLPFISSALSRGISQECQIALRSHEDTDQNPPLCHYSTT